MKLFAIFGNPVSHSKSPIMHNNVFDKLGFDGCYTRVLLEDGKKLKEKFLKLNLSGANITVPHKEDAFRACDEVVGFAKEIGVVNTIIKKGDKLIGYNTDADGFIYAIDELKGIKTALIIGAGGTAKALAKRLKLEDIKVDILNRSEANLAYFKEFDTFTWSSFKPKKYNIVINTTSAGLKDEDLPAPLELLNELLSNTNYATDAIYGKVTPFLKLAKSKNIPTKDGLDMLLGQGVLANMLFTNSAYDKKEIEKHMRYALSL